MAMRILVSGGAGYIGSYVGIDGSDVAGTHPDGYRE